MTEDRTYSITTEERTYNSVNSKEQFQTVRENWNDTSKVLAAWIWDSYSGSWIKQSAPKFW